MDTKCDSDGRPSATLTHRDWFAVTVPRSQLGSYLGERVQIGSQDQHGDHHHQRHTQACYLVRERAGVSGFGGLVTWMACP